MIRCWCDCLKCGANDLHMVQLMLLPRYHPDWFDWHFSCQLTQVVLENRLLNGCVCVSQYLCFIWFFLFMAALHSRCGHYIFALWFLLLSFFFFLAQSLQSQSGCLPYFHTWCGLTANLRCRSETCCTRLCGNTGCKMTQKIAISAPTFNFVGLCLPN